MIPPALARIIDAVDAFMASLSVLFLFGGIAVIWRMIARMLGG